MDVRPAPSDQPAAPPAPPSPAPISDIAPAPPEAVNEPIAAPPMPEDSGDDQITPTPTANLLPDPPKKPVTNKAPGSHSNTAAIVGTVVIVIVLAALAVFAYLKQH